MIHSWHWVASALAGSAAAVWIGFAPNDPVQVVAALACTVVVLVAAAWYARVEDARRLRRVVDVYVELALAGEKSRKRAKPRAKKSAVSEPRA